MSYSCWSKQEVSCSEIHLSISALIAPLSSGYDIHFIAFMWLLVINFVRLVEFHFQGSMTKILNKLLVTRLEVLPTIPY